MYLAMAKKYLSLFLGCSKVKGTPSKDQLTEKDKKKANPPCEERFLRRGNPYIKKQRHGDPL
jgi:hypothetical protein